MEKYVCDACGYVYDPAEGDEAAGIKPGTSFADLPDDWACPLCGLGKDPLRAIKSWNTTFTDAWNVQTGNGNTFFHGVVIFKTLRRWLDPEFNTFLTAPRLPRASGFLVVNPSPRIKRFYTN